MWCRLALAFVLSLAGTTLASEGAVFTAVDEGSGDVALYRQAGWQRGTYDRKGWLKKAASRVDVRAVKWSTQLQGCEEELNDRWWIFGD